MVYLYGESLTTFFESKPLIDLSILFLVIGTNLLWYVSSEPFMSHALTFSVVSITQFYFFLFLKLKDRKSAYIVSALLGVIFLLRPILILLLIYFLIISLYKMDRLKSIKWPTALFSLGIFLIVVFPQMLYYKLVTGYWWYNAYQDEPFIFTQPELFQFLFSARKGWLTYTPIMLISIAGLFMLYKKNKEITFALSIFLGAFIFLSASWWCWPYQAGYGMRVMTDLYGLMAIPFCSLLFTVRNFNVKFYHSFLPILFLLTGLNLFQSWQYKNGLLHFDWMTREAYWYGFLQTTADIGWYDRLKPYDYDRRKKGLKQVEYNETLLDTVSENTFFYFRSCETLEPVSIYNPYALLYLRKNELTQYELFRLVAVGEMFAIKASNNKFLSLKPQSGNILIADQKLASRGATLFKIRFIEEDDNKVNIVTENGQLLTVAVDVKNKPVLALGKANSYSLFRMIHVEVNKPANNTN